MKTYNIAAIGGDGIGPEVVEAGIRVLDTCAGRDGGFGMRFKEFDWVRTHASLAGTRLRPMQLRCKQTRRQTLALIK
jgi:isocitrate/isopropylmalate dehydrogenase